MDENLLQQLEAYLKDTYVDLSRVLCQTAPISSQKRPSPKLATSIPKDSYHQLELNLPPLEDTFAAQLLKLIRLKGKEEAEVYKKANIDRRLFSKIRTNNDYTPSKATILALIFALELETSEAADLLKRAGYCLSRSQKGDVIVHFFLKNHIYDLFTVQEALAHYGLKMPGS